MLGTKRTALRIRKVNLAEEHKGAVLPHQRARVLRV